VASLTFYLNREGLKNLSFKMLKIVSKIKPETK
jgi:hypothetical protein